MTYQRATTVLAALLIGACSTPIDIQPPTPQPEAPPPPGAQIETPRPRPKIPFTCPVVAGATPQSGNSNSTPSIRADTDFHQYRNLRFETLTLVRNGILSSRIEHGLTSAELDQIFHTITEALADEWRQRLAWVTPPGRGGRTVSADLWLEGLPASGTNSGTPTRLSITLRDNASGDLLLAQCHMRVSSPTEGEALAEAVQSLASQLASHMEAASH